MTIRTPRPAAITAREIVTDPATFASPHHYAEGFSEVIEKPLCRASHKIRPQNVTVYCNIEMQAYVFKWLFFAAIT